MTATKTRKAPAKSPIVRHLEWVPGNFHYFEVESSKSGVFYAPEVELEGDCHVRCNCKDFEIRHARFEPCIGDTGVCKHILLCIEWLLDSGDLDPAELEAKKIVEVFQPCINCKMPDAEYIVCDEKGIPYKARLCSYCLNELRATREVWSPYAQELRAQIAILEADLLMWPDAESLRTQLMDLWQQFMACEPKKATQ